MRLQIILLKNAEVTQPDIPGRQATLSLQNKVPSLELFHRTFAQLTAQEPTIVAILAAAKTLFPCGANPEPSLPQNSAPTR